MKEYIQNLKAKPEHVRKRIALGTSVGITALVGVLWITTLATTGAFALAPVGGTTQTKDDSFALTSTGVKSSFSELMGAVGAVTNATSSKPALTIIDGNTSSTLDATTTPNNSSATAIPF